ncbi:diguanylate cyclase domain-containing protein [Paraburkholderia sp. D1E]|uniref:diguanylate cyclase domain-containing protein n=1 Tax=Paraburkholderia sp. D1E TaxID=3461398 RepID=UPI0040451FBC
MRPVCSTAVSTKSGGEEFAVILPDTMAEGALHLAEKIRRKARRRSICWRGQGGRA